jgi:nucleoside-diphosphate-sugar epimerase
MPHAEPTPIVAPSLVVVTGANGFIASHTVQTLLRAGFAVCGTVRSTAKAEAVTRNVRQLNSPDTAANFTTAVVPDITDSAAYLELFRTTQPAAVLHLASPFAYTVANFEEDLMKPAVKGTLAVLEAAAVTASVRRVVHTNSFACIYDASLGMRPGYTYTAKDWCPLTYADGVNAVNAPTAYRASKAVAEKTAWEFLDSHRDVHFDLVSLCPAMVFGPFLDAPDALPSSPTGLNTSNQLVWDVLRTGENGPMPPTKGPVWVDVRDVADAHVRALEMPEMGGRRFLLAKDVYCTQEIADVAREVLPPKHRHRVPMGVPGQREAGNHFAVDARIEERLLGTGGKWRELYETLADLGPQLYGIETRASATVAEST